MSTLEGTMMHPRYHIGHDETYLNDFSSLAQVKIQFPIFFLIKVLGFHVVNFSIDVSITTVGVGPGLWSRSRWSRMFSAGVGYQNCWSQVRSRNICCNYRLQCLLNNLNYNINCLKIRTHGRTDRHGFGILTWKHADTQKISTQSSKLVVSRQSLYTSRRPGMHN